MLLAAAFLLIGALQAASPQDRPASPARSAILSDFQRFLTGADADRDGALSLAEW
jgi:hypothetical protein